MRKLAPFLLVPLVIGALLRVDFVFTIFYLLLVHGKVVSAVYSKSGS